MACDEVVNKTDKVKGDKEKKERRGGVYRGMGERRKGRVAN